jgi:hypothetical protein
MLRLKDGTLLKIQALALAVKTTPHFGQRT